MSRDFHFIPGHFADGLPRFLDRLVRGATGWRLAALTPMDDAADVDGRAWLSGTPAGEMRFAAAEFCPVGAASFRGMVCVRAVRADRALVSLAVPEAGAPSAVDTEMALLGLSCACLAGEGQGATLIGMDLGPPGAETMVGTVAEQVRATVSATAMRVLVVVTTVDTARALAGTASPEGAAAFDGATGFDRVSGFEGFYEKPLADLREFRRTSAG